jgi:F0F1-type ATP synthase assembly protein I
VAYNGTNNLKYVVDKVIKYQIIQGIIAVIVIAIITRHFIDIYSGVCGLIIALVPTIVYSKIAVSNKIDSFYVMYKKHKQAMILKFIVNCLGFLVVFILFRHVSALSLFIVYFVTLCGHWTSVLTSSMVKK